ncbi:hypothetical protein MRB53_008819 [Persea americana]|uniref:Uncharacterized protein n=1 Tax=Persea americana TaxID=3435 RepID=A0ACC2LMC8_PERAE|nr:hypothetical protein MRB53_008819 [Persea americana]
MEEEEICNTGLVLGIGPIGCGVSKKKCHLQQKPPVRFHLLFPSVDEEQEVDGSSSKVTDEGEDYGSRVGNDHERNHTRKKLRLSKEQSSLLEDSFKEHNTLTPMEKQELAEKLNLKPRQVEVWFQNRRARTKLKQMEVDCEFLKRCCESLSEENRRLKKELQELKSIKLTSPFYIQLHKAAATKISVCPSCERVAMNDGKIAKTEIFGAMENSSMTNWKVTT